MRNNLVFQKADIAKANITNEAKRDIEKLYSNWADEIGKKAEYYKTKTNASSWLQEQNMRQLQAQLEATSKHIANEVSGIVKDTIYQVSDAVVQANNEWLINLGFPVSGVESAFVSVPDQTVRRLVTGQIYDSGWSLSKSIWGDNEDTLKKLYEIVGQGLAQNMSVYDISKLLEQYVRPERAKQWNLRMADGRKIYPKSVDYNAQRLARTLAQHGYQTSFIAVTEKNPFIIDVIWRANGSRVCELCMDRDGQHFPKDDLPLDHPNGMCVMEPNVDSNMTDKLADWINNPDGTFPEIDEFAKQFGYVPENKVSVQANNNEQKINNVHYVAQGKDITNIWSRRPERFDFEIEDVINAQGFDGLPRVVSTKEFNELVKQANDGAGFIAQRTYSAPSQEILDKYRDQLYNGKWYVDCSTGGASHGKGMYCIGNYGNNITNKMTDGMMSYGANNPFSYIETFTLEKDAKIIKEDDIKNLFPDLGNNLIKKHINKYDLSDEDIRFIAASSGIGRMEAMTDLYMKNPQRATELMKMRAENKDFNNDIINAYNEFLSLSADNGVVATLFGYDAIDCGRTQDYFVILNRTKVIFKGE